MKKDFRRPSDVFNLNPIRFVEGNPTNQPLAWRFSSTSAPRPTCNLGNALPVQAIPLPSVPALPSSLVEMPFLYSDFKAPAHQARRATSSAVPSQQYTLTPPSFHSIPPPPSRTQPASGGFFSPKTPTFPSVQPASAGFFAPETPAQSFFSAAQPALQAQSSGSFFVPETPAADNQPFLREEVSTSKPEPFFQQEELTPLTFKPEPLVIKRHLRLRCGPFVNFIRNAAHAIPTQLTQLLVTSSYQPKVLFYGDSTRLYNLTKLLQANGIQVREFVGHQESVWCVYTVTDITRLTLIPTVFPGYVTVVRVKNTVPLQSFPDPVYSIDISTSDKNTSPELFKQIIKIPSAEGLRDRRRQLSILQRGYNLINRYLGYNDSNYVYDNAVLIESTTYPKIEYLLQIVRQLANMHILVISAHPLAPVREALVSNGIACNLLDIQDNAYSHRQFLDDANVLLYEYDPLIGQANAYNIDHFWPGPRRVYLMEEPINAFATDYLMQMKLIDNHTIVLFGRYTDTDDKTTDMFFYDRTQDSFRALQQ